MNRKAVSDIKVGEKVFIEDTEWESLLGRRKIRRVTPAMVTKITSKVIYTTDGKYKISGLREITPVGKGRLLWPSKEAFYDSVDYEIKYLFFWEKFRDLHARIPGTVTYEALNEIYKAYKRTITDDEEE